MQSNWFYFRRWLKYLDTFYAVSARYTGFEREGGPLGFEEFAEGCRIMGIGVIGDGAARG